MLSPVLCISGNKFERTQTQRFRFMYFAVVPRCRSSSERLLDDFDSEAQTLWGHDVGMGCKLWHLGFIS